MKILLEPVERCCEGIDLSLASRRRQSLYLASLFTFWKIRFLSNAVSSLFDDNGSRKFPSAQSCELRKAMQVDN